jgi:K+-transporting ATPase ATPase B chain
MTSTQDLYPVRPALVKPAIADAFRKLDPRVQWRNPVMFVVYVGSILTTLLWLQALAARARRRSRLHPRHRAVAVVHGAVRQLRRSAGRGPQQGAGRVLRGLKKEDLGQEAEAGRGARWPWHPLEAERSLRKGDVVLVEAGDTIPADGEVIEGVASVDESAITGESAPVIRESGGDFSSVTGGTRVLSDWLVVRVTVNPGETFVDRMIAMVETPSARRRRTRSR